TLIIGGALTVPTGGTLHFTAATLLVQGRIEGPGASGTPTPNNGPADLNTEIDAGTGNLDVNATGNIDVHTRLKAQGGGSVTVSSGGTLATRNSAVIEVDPGGSAALSGDAGVTVGGKIFAEGSTVQIDSSAGTVTIDQQIRAAGSS